MSDSPQHLGYQAAYIARQASELSKALLGTKWKDTENPSTDLKVILLRMQKTIERLDERMDELERKFEEFEQTSNYHLVLARKPEGM